ncbi:hypothetical protein B0A48_07354 [Cryoendolithus antarcticus]|uniref:ATPase AAA-type core domain-containing protein n=1 Tax=Cryoendolithus antarcticus TaxID=1507870 RepID=A0A1V8T8C5_9PEZI|nr:hypothetical protein B0A48_07354 [Cryoendolithus antarcticus]
MDEPFTLVPSPTSPPSTKPLYPTLLSLTSAKTADHDLQFTAFLRTAHPSNIVTCTPMYNANLLAFARAGYASATRDTATDSLSTWRGYVPPRTRSGQGGLAEQVHFAKYIYIFGDIAYVLYTVGAMQYILAERSDSEDALGPSGSTDNLILAIGAWQSSMNGTVWVFDGYWTRSADLYKEVEKASWDKVILKESMKKDLTSVIERFFDSKEVYEDLGVPWKRGLIFGGPPGNGKTISIKALMHTLLFERAEPIPTLYVKSAPNSYSIRAVFTQARALAPCLLVLEDIETIVTPNTRSYFFNELDGLENNDGLFVVASTNFLERLDPGLSKRPSRFDRTYIFPLPDLKERVMYCEFWRSKLKHKKSIDFPLEMCNPMAAVTDDFSFAFLQECFVATLLIIARRQQDRDGTDDGGDDEDLRKWRRYELFKVFEEQAKLLRKQLEGSKTVAVETMTLSEARLQVDVQVEALPVRGLRRSDSTEGQLLVLHAEASEDVLPDLPYQAKKQYVINSAAWAAKQ